MNFLSTTKREDFWVNDIRSPFVHPTNFQNPAPGEYPKKEKKEKGPHHLLADQSLPPFGSTAQRDCNKKPNARV